MGKVELHLEIDAELLAQANEEGVPLDAALEAGIRAALAQATDSRTLHAFDEEAAARQWADENVAAIESHQKFIDQFGVFGEDLRTW